MDNSAPQQQPLGLQGLNPFPDAVAQTQTPKPTPEDNMEATQKALQAKKQQQEKQNAAQISQAMSLVNPKSDSPMVQVGKAIQSPEYAGYCQQFVDDNTGAKQRYPTAYATWQAKVQNGQAQQGTDGLQPGDVVEFQPDKSNGNLGHAAIVQKDGNLKMATYNGVQTFSLKNWINYSGQTPLGYYRPT